MTTDTRETGQISLAGGSIRIGQAIEDFAEDSIVCPFVFDLNELNDAATRFGCELDIRHLLERYVVLERNLFEHEQAGATVMVGPGAARWQNAWIDTLLHVRQSESMYDFIVERPLHARASELSDSVLPPATSLLEGILRLTSQEASTPALAAIPRLREFAGLPRGWDGYDAEPIHQGLVDRAFDTLVELAAQAIRAGVSLPRPAVSASPAGSIHFEWDVPGGFLDVECPPEPEPLAFLMEPQGGSEIEDIASSPEDLWAKVSAVFA